MKSKEKLILERKYRKGSYVFQPVFTPKELPHVTPGCEIKRMEMLADGLVEVDGKEYTFHTVRILIQH